MRTLQARAIFLSFVGLAAVITYNATYLQNGPHPAPISVEPAGADGQAQRAVQISSRSAAVPANEPETTASLPRSKTVLSVQRRLSENGYEPGPLDGVHGVLTRAAFMAYQYDHDLPVTGEGATQLLEHMILGDSAGQSAGDSKTPMPEETVALIKAVQQILGNMGYEAGPVDGIMGSKTRAAIRAFERDRNLPVKGRISGKALKAIMEATGASLDKIQSS